MIRIPKERQQPEDPRYPIALEKTKEFKGKEGTVVVDGKEYQYSAIEYFEGHERMYLATVVCEGVRKTTKARSTVRAYATAFMLFLPQ